MSYVNKLFSSRKIYDLNAADALFVKAMRGRNSVRLYADGLKGMYPLREYTKTAVD